MAWLPDDEKIEDMFFRFDRMYERDRQTHKQTPHTYTGRHRMTPKAARQKSVHSFSKYRVHKLGNGRTNERT